MSEFYKCEHGEMVCGFCLKMLDRQYKDVESDNNGLRKANEELVKALKDVLSYDSDAPVTILAQADEALQSSEDHK